MYLAYAYLNATEYDAFGSLLDEDVSVHLPGEESVRGKDSVMWLEFSRDLVYSLESVWTTPGGVFVTGVVHPRTDSAGAVGFVDILTFSPCGLLLTRKRFHAEPPGVNHPLTVGESSGFQQKFRTRVGQLFRRWTPC
ncbi:hypothetical protein EES43_07005 [Streptomyces sp. ADI96-02]|uniref:nuclear transport factor 2 family protein n=1 Tax=unclassified Streptomyces TaxID=2593676 RepID=UPI000F55079F|nr:nuclear transport factor 2 family protein [Streptomyces sp. ADI96-02]RPK65811.1 hypothetical protein EES43_07005 [Streptomyces sp. ADI96-02]